MARTFRLPHSLQSRFGPLLRRRSHRQARCCTALSNQPALEAAVADLSRQLRAGGQSGVADLALVFCSTAYATDLQRLLPLLREAIPSRHWIGCAGGGVVGTDGQGQPHELEHQPGISVSLLQLPGSVLQLFHLEAGGLPDLDGPSQQWVDWVGAQPEGAHSMLLFIDPGCPAINDLISGLDYAYPQAAKVGGIAGQHNASHGSLLLDDQVVEGAVGCLISGAWRIDPVVAQGCRPIGPVFEVEKAERNVVQRLSDGDHQGTPVACLQAILEQLNPEERELVRHSLFLGVAKSSFQLSSSDTPDDAAFLVRNLIGVDPRTGSVAVGERLRVGQRVQFQLRDANASRQEQRQLLSSQRRRQPEPLAALLFACLGRGEGLYGQPDGDVSACREQFDHVPVAGAFCNGEIGPVAGATHLHGYTASWGFLVPNHPPCRQPCLLSRMVRQHVNPLSRFFQLPLELPAPVELFADPQLPIHLDIGCARGRFLLALAQQQPGVNHLGVEIRRALVQAAEADRQALALGNLHYLFCNANVSLQAWMAALPAGQLDLVSIQFPDPWFKKKHHKRRVLQPELLLAIASALAPGQRLFMQSDVLAVIEPMVGLTEACGCFSRPAADGRPWRANNPLPVPTERETYVQGQGLPVYRVLYERNQAPLPELAVLEQWLEATPEPTDNPLEPAAPTA